MTLIDYFIFSFSLKYLPISLITARIPGRTSSADHELVFKADVPAFGFSTYFFEVKSNRITHLKIYLSSKFSLANEELKEKRNVEIKHNELCTLENEVRIDV